MVIWPRRSERARERSLPTIRAAGSRRAAIGRTISAARGSGPNVPETRTAECLDDELGIVDWPPKGSGAVEWPDNDYFAVILKHYLATGRAIRGRVGNADAELIDAADIVDFGARWMTEHLRG